MMPPIWSSTSVPTTASDMSKKDKGSDFTTDKMPYMAFAERSWGRACSPRDEVKSLIEH